METNLEVRVRFPSVGMEVVGLWVHGCLGGRPEREARRDEGGPVVQHIELLVGLIFSIAGDFPFEGAWGAM